MKISTLLLALTFSFLIAKSQSVHKVPYYNWANPISFKLSPSPTIHGNGVLSDSLLNIYEVNSVYEYNEEYYLINSWADYYLWYTTKYWFHFEDAELYSYYYHNNDNYNMVNFIANNFKGPFYPSRIAVTKDDSDQIFDNWTTKKILADNSIKSKKYAVKLDKEFKRQLNIRMKNDEKLNKMDLNSSVKIGVSNKLNLTSARDVNNINNSPNKNIKNYNNPVKSNPTYIQNKYDINRNTTSTEINKHPNNSSTVQKSVTSNSKPKNITKTPVKKIN